MEFDPWFADNLPRLSGIFLENPSPNSEISTIVHVQPSSTLSPPPPSSHETFLYQNNYLSFHQNPLNETNHYNSFPMKDSSSTNPFFMIPTTLLGNLYQDAHTNGSLTNLDSLQNFNKIECVNGFSNNGISYFDRVNKNPLQYGGISQSQVCSSLSPLLVHDADAYEPMKPKIKDEILQIVGMGNNIRDRDLRLNVGSQKMQRRMQEKNIECHNSGTNKIIHQWTVDEDRIFVELVNLYGLKKWEQFENFIDGRNGKQCRERWINHLRPNIRKEPWSYEEEKILIEAHKEVGTKWVEIERRLLGRTQNNIKNHWNSTKRRLTIKRTKNKRKYGKGTLLEKYIMEVTNAEGHENERNRSIGSKDNRNNKNEIGISCACNWSSEGDLNSES